jgi:hypothetical protein
MEVYDSDVRYGSSFLSVSNNRQSAPGEVMTDKLTGEIYIKRPSDGKIVSFKQKSQTVYQTIEEFDIQFQSSQGFKYPRTKGAFLLGTKLNVDEMKAEDNQRDLLQNNYSFGENVGSEEDLRLDLSTKTNGFFIKPITRNGDRLSCGYLSGLFLEQENADFKSNVRNFTDWLDLSTLYESPYNYTEWKKLDQWEQSTGIVEYTITTVGTDSNGKVITNVKDGVATIKLNEYTVVRFPEDYAEELENIISIQAVITKLRFPKLQYERYINTEPTAASGIDPTLTQLLEPDNKVVLTSIDTLYFIDSASELPSNQSIIINQIVDTVFLEEAMVELSNANGSKSVQSYEEEPSSFPTDTVWAEEIRTVNADGESEETSSTTKFEDLEKNLYHDTEDVVELTYQMEDPTNLYFVEI